MPIKKKTVRKKVTRKKPVRKKRVKKKTDKTIIFMKGATMPRKRKYKKRRKAPRRVYRKRRVARRRYYGAARKPATNIMSILMQGVGITGGAVGGSMVARMIPIKDLRIKSLIPVLLGVGIMSTKQGKKGLVKDAALGSTAIGFISLLKTLAPQVPLLAADETELALLGYADDMLDEEENAMLGLPIGEDDDLDDLDDLDGEEFDDLDGEEDDLEESEYMGIPIGEGASPADF